MYCIDIVVNLCIFFCFQWQKHSGGRASIWRWAPRGTPFSPVSCSGQPASITASKSPFYTYLSSSRGGWSAPSSRPSPNWPLAFSQYVRSSSASRSPHLQCIAPPGGARQPIRC